MTTRLTWKCAICHQPVADDTGYIELPRSEIARFRAEQADWDRTHDAGKPTALFRRWTMRELDDLPRSAHWWAIHFECDSDPGVSFYWFGVERCRTIDELLDWTAHLSEKAWLAETDWPDLLRSKVRVNA